LALLVAVVGLGSAASAMAGQEDYCGGTYMSGVGCYGYRHSLTANLSFSNPYNADHLEGASALDTNYNQYGSWAYAYGYACHVYSGNNLLYPWLYNPMAITQSILGHMKYGVDGGCNVG
jgi:hypothetical protein